MKIIGDEWWCVRGGSDGQGNDLATLTSTQWDSTAIASVSERYRYLLPFQATDLAFDGSYLWLVDRANSKICKMEGFLTSVIGRSKGAGHSIPITLVKSSNNILRITMPPDRPPSSAFFQIVDMKGRTVARVSPNFGNVMSYDYSALSPGIYGIKNRKGTRPAKGTFFISP
jgi:hypothetical protein